MREIKFRVWDRRKKKMLYRVGIDFLGNPHFEGGSPYRREGFELMQYTGLKDKNGKEIYEGDIIIPTPNEWNEPPLFIRFNEGCFIISRSHTLNKTFWEIGYQIEVIGNIHENPELLEKK